MKQAILLHNAGAGEEDHTQADLIEAIEQGGFGCVYFPLKEDNSWKDQLEHADFAIVAGGDGTVRSVVKELVKRTALEKRIPIAILPMGTANNLSRTLSINRKLDLKSHIQNWQKMELLRFDVGLIKNTDTTEFFLESTGYGAFAQLMQKMDTVDTAQLETTEDRIQCALENLLAIAKTMPAAHYSIQTDDQVYEGNCLLLEVMNIPSIGPNLILSPEAVTDDGVFNVVCVAEDQREEFVRFIEARLTDDEATFPWKTFTTKKLTIDCDSAHMHVDDEQVVPYHTPAILEVRENVLDFLISK